MESINEINVNTYLFLALSNIHGWNWSTDFKKYFINLIVIANIILLRFSNDSKILIFTHTISNENFYT